MNITTNLFSKNTSKVTLLQLQQLVDIDIAHQQVQSNLKQ